MIEEKRRRESSGPMPVPGGPGLAGPEHGGSKPAFGNFDKYSRDKSRVIARNKTMSSSRNVTNMKIHSYQRGVGNNTNTKVNSYRTNSANGTNRHNTSNTTRMNQRSNKRD